jgi:hypothetical protein
MSDVKAQRRQWVQDLRSAAFNCGVDRVPDNGNRIQVHTMVMALFQSSELKPDDRQLAEAAWVSYRDSFPSGSFPTGVGATPAISAELAPGAPAPPPETAQPNKEWKFQAAQLTYNSTVGEWASSSEDILKALMARILIFIQAVLAPLNAKGISITIERSLKTDFHHHSHVYFHLEKPYHRRGLDVFVFEGLRPHIETNTCSGKTYKAGVNRGHFYVFCDKRGSICSWADYVPFVDYPVEGWWLDQWFKAGKFLEYSRRIGIGFQRRLADVRACESYEREKAVQAHVCEQAALLEGDTFPVKSFPIVEQFVALFDGKPRHRRPILVIVGGSNLGKSLLACAILKRIATNLALPGFLEITVEDTDFLDFSSFDHRQHGGIVLDGVGDTLVLHRNREVLQGRPKVNKGGKSATMMYAYGFTLSNRAVIATLDLSAAHLDQLEENHWLSNPGNVLLLRLAEKAYDEPASSSNRRAVATSCAEAPPSPPRPATKRRVQASPSINLHLLPPLPAFPKRL